jgi:tetratricopeptide (TPR) repeat protein
MKKYVVIIFTLAIILTGCGSSKKQLQRGNYDAAIATAVKELRRNPDNEKQVDILERSYTVVNEQDNEKIRYLKMENRPQNWDEIYLAYKRMNDRQSLVRTVMPLNSGGRSIELPYVDYMPEMVNAKRKSADYYYAHGVELMKTGIKENYRQAYAEFIRAKDYVGDYEDIDNKIREAKYLGMSRIFVSLQNSTMIVFPKDFEEDLLTVDLQALNNES